LEERFYKNFQFLL